MAYEYFKNRLSPRKTNDQNCPLLTMIKNQMGVYAVSELVSRGAGLFCDIYFDFIVYKINSFFKECLFYCTAEISQRYRRIYPFKKSFFALCFSNNKTYAFVSIPDIYSHNIFKCILISTRNCAEACMG